MAIMYRVMLTSTTQGDTSLSPGKRYEFDDEDVLRIVKFMRASETNFAVMLYFLFPKLAKMLPKYIRSKWMLEDIMLGMRDENYKLCKVSNVS